MPRPRYDNLDADKKARLLEVATAEFAAHGYDGASINRILEGAGFSKGSFYYYFDDKDDLAGLVLLTHAEPLTKLGALRAPDSVETFWSELWRVSLVQLRELESKRTIYACVTRLSSALTSHPEFGAKVIPAFARARHDMLHFIEQGQALGAVRSDLSASLLISLMQSVKTAAYAEHFAGDRVPTEAEMRAFTDLVFELARRLCDPRPKGGTP